MISELSFITAWHQDGLSHLFVGVIHQMDRIPYRPERDSAVGDSVPENRLKRIHKFRSINNTKVKIMCIMYMVTAPTIDMRVYYPCCR